MSTSIVKINGQDVQRGMTAREEFSGAQVQSNAETAMTAVAARERAIVEAEYLMAERHPRRWMDVRARMLDHCSRPRFAEVSRYAKPIGKEKVNGEWVEKKARGFSARFAETLSQEMGNIKPVSAVTFEDDLIRIVRIGVTDLERNLPRAREVTFARTVEKRGKQDKKTQAWSPPEGREVLSHRINSYGEPSFLVKATEDEMRSKVNSEESKTQRDFILKLCPRDILEDCEDLIYATLEKEDKTDPKAVIKRWLDNFQKIGVFPSDLTTYLAKPVEQWTDREIKELRELAAAIKEGTSFQECLRLKFSVAEGGEDETTQEHDARLQRQMAEQEQRIKTATNSNRAADGKPPITQADIDAEIAKKDAAPEPVSDEELDARNRQIDAEIAVQEAQSPEQGDKPKFGMKRK